IAWSFVPTVIILSAVAWFTFYSYQKVIGDLAIREDLAVLDTKIVQAADGINNLINGPLRPIILNIDTKPDLPLEVRALNILDRAPNLDIFDGGIYFVDQHGIIFKTQPEEPELIGQDWSDTFQFRYVRDNPPGAGPLTNIQAIGKNETGIVCVIWPMHNTLSEFIGAGYYCLAIQPNEQDILYTTVNSLSLGQNVYILDGNQRIIYSPDPAELGQDLSKETYIQQLLQSESRSVRFQKGMEDWVINYGTLVRAKNPSASWILVSEQSWDEVMQPSLPYRRLLYLLLALGVIVPVLVTAYGVRHITEPIQKLIRAAEQLTAGEFKHKIEVKTGDEIETLADQFNLMSAELDDSYSLLEKKVAERTHELATLNAIAARVSSSLDLNEIMADALERIMELTGMEHGIAYRVAGGEGGAANTGTDAEEAYLRVMALRGFPPNFADFGERVPLRRSAAGVAGRRAEPVIWALEELPTVSALRERLATLGVKQVIAIPLMSKARMVGSLNLSTNQSRTYPPEQVALLKTIGQQIGVAVENARLYEEAEQAAIAAERHRLARELHDAVTQTLFSANLIADVLPRIWKRNPDEGFQNLEELRQLTRGALAEMRTLLLEMRPESLERADIKSLLTQLADAFIGRVRVPLDLEITGDCELTHEVKLVLYRVAQEALNNIAKHSGARQVDVQLDCQPGQLSLCIKDDGLGFEPDSLSPGHMGIAIMQERASSIGACLKIDSQPGQGTTVELDWRSGRKDGTDEHL
ncbi:MAG TPA: histidine kinase, partial [Anaerolineales bacterium]|nr:histidine kinase [Anaerolineales bacterium]